MISTFMSVIVEAKVTILAFVRVKTTNFYQFWNPPLNPLHQPRFFTLKLMNSVSGYNQAFWVGDLFKIFSSKCRFRRMEKKKRASI